MHIRKMTTLKYAQEPGFSLVELVSAIRSLLAVSAIFGKDLAKEEDQD